MKGRRFIRSSASSARSSEVHGVGTSSRGERIAKAPSVSVVIPCYNYGRFLPDAVGSALDQFGVDIEVIVVDDHSTDESAEVAEALARNDHRIRFVKHRENAGHVETYNHGLALASREYVVKLDADDLLTEGSLARSAALLSAFPTVTFCYGHAVEFRGSRRNTP